MHASWKIASSALLLVLAGTAGCAAGGEDPANEDASLTAAEADQTPGQSGINLSVNINQNGWNDDQGGARHHGGHHGFWGGHGGHHGCGNQPPIPATPIPAAPDAPVPPPPPQPAPAQPPPG
jgi:hypothetical protein